VGYNNWPDLELTIQSALCQSYQSVEVIVVDNDSSDATPQEVPRRFGDAVWYIRQPNRGDGGAYNTGMGLATGEFVQFLDGDDFLAPNKIEKEMEVFRAEPEVDIVFGDVRHFQTLAGIPQWEDWDNCDHLDSLAALVGLDGARLWLQHPLYRRCALERVGPWDESLYVADQDYWLRAAWVGCKFRYCPGSLVFYRKRPGQMTADMPAVMRGVEEVWAKALGYITREPYRGAITRHLAQVRFRLAIYQDGMTKRESLAKLALARAANRNSASALAYTVGWLLIVLPGCHLLVKALRPLLRRVAHLLGV
jgi:glycosyltransferase involved in cell wall biosynthesis